MEKIKLLLRAIKSLILAKKKSSLAIGAGLIVLSVAALTNNSKKPEYITAIVTRQDLKQIVSVTGKVKAEQDISLAFEGAGIVKSTLVKPGDQVAAGSLLAELENSELRAQLAQAKATLDKENVRLNELKSGTRQEELRVYETKADTAQTGLAEAQTSAITSLQSVYANAEDAIRNKINQVFDTPYSYYPTRIKFISIYPDTERKLCGQKESIEYLLNDWNKSLPALDSASDITANLDQAKNNLNSLKEFAETMALLINSVASNDVNSGAQITTWRTDITNGRNAIISAMAAIDNTKENIESAESALQLATDELNLKRAGSTKDQILLQELQVNQAQASYQAAAAQLNKTMLRSPIAGLITKVNLDPCEAVSLNTPLIQMITGNKYKVEVNAPEVEIAKIHLQDQTLITLDAYGDSVAFQAYVGLIDPSETVIDGVPTYKTTLFFLMKIAESGLV